MSDDIKLPELPDFDLKGVHVDGFSIKALEDYARATVELNRAWLPIESAPKDGTTVILWLGGPYPRMVFACWCKPLWGGEQWWQLDDTTGIEEKEPTRWMPPPQPPESNNDLENDR